ncbi:MAG: UDP-glucose 6-dehydrogenase [Owenweeksia sp. TMED14]|nr:MAG: UDP-glucose 6-dehydrogenase [Owenweeksia sp. TMED14]
MKVTVIGTGYVGLVTGACLSDVGMQVTCVDTDIVKINNLKKGILPIYEPGLQEIVDRNSKSGRLCFSTSLKDVLSNSEVAFIAVGTPPGEDGSADLKYVLTVASEIGKYSSDYLVTVTKSTVPVGTASKVKSAINKELKERGAKHTIDIASNPEFLKEGAAIDDFMKPDRIVCGVDSNKAKSIISNLYKPFTLNGHPILFMDIPSAEMTKYAANAMLATKISFINDIANLCELTGANINNVRKGIGSDSRIGNSFIYPGIGYGGSCFPKDVKALVKSADENGHSLRILQAVEDVNQDQKKILVKKIIEEFGEDLNGKKFAFWGLSFKPETDDMREAPSLVIAHELLRRGAKISAYDPVATDEAKKILGDKISYSNDAYSALKNADALLLITEWREFRSTDWGKVKTNLKTAVVFDGRNIYDGAELRSHGFNYYGIGVK